MTKFNPESRLVRVGPGTAGYPYLDKPDMKFSQKYKTDLILPKEQAREYVEVCKELLRESFGSKTKGASVPYKVNKEDGTVTFRFKSNMKPGLFDIKGKKVNSSKVKLASGSIIKVAGKFQTYKTGPNFGVTAYFSAVQVLKLVEFGGGSEGVFGDATDELEDSEDVFVASDEHITGADEDEDEYTEETEAEFFGEDEDDDFGGPEDF